MTEKSYPSMFSVEQKYGAWLDHEELEMVRGVKEFVEGEMIPRRNEYEGGWQKDAEIAHEAIADAYRGLTELGVQRAPIPEQNGGLGLSNQALNAMKEEISRADSGITTALGKIHWVVGVLGQARNTSLMEKFLPEVTGDSPKTAAILITEEHGGANIEDGTQEGRPIRVTAEKEGDEYVIDGHKKWGGAGGPPEVFDTVFDDHLGYFVVTNMAPEKGAEGMAIFHVPPDADGLSFSDPFEKAGHAYTDRNIEYWFDGVRIPEEFRVDDPDRPMQAAHITHGAIMAGGKIASAATLLGSAHAAMEIAMDYTADRQIKGKPARERPMFANMFGELARDIESARTYYMTVGGMIGDPEKHGALYEKPMVGRAGAARSTAADVTTKVFDKAFQLTGSAGFAYDADLDKLKRDTKIVQLWLGGSQRDRLDMARAYHEHDWETPDDFAWHYEEESDLTTSEAATDD
jgi:alkylation response protein AidB-like acyl-CoA dehydrogenase